MSDSDEKKPASPPPAAPAGADKPAAAAPAKPAAAATSPKPAAAAAKAAPVEQKTPPDESPLYQRMKAAAPDLLDEGSHIHMGDLVLKVKRERAGEACRVLRDQLGFDYLCHVTAIDYPDRPRRFEVVWTLMSIEHKVRLNVVADAADGEPVPSVVDLWITAGWHERETWDMFGIRFDGNPDLRRILLPEWWEGFPLRKDYPVEGRGEHERVVEECLRPKE